MMGHYSLTRRISKVHIAPLCVIIRPAPSGFPRATECKLENVASIFISSLRRRKLELVRLGPHRVVVDGSL